MGWEKRIKKAGERYRVLPFENDWPRRLSITVRIRDDGVIYTRTIALSMPVTDRSGQKTVFNACIIRDRRKTDCLMNRKGYLKVLEALSSITLPAIQPSQSPFCTMSREILFIIEIGDPYTPQRSRFQWKNPGREGTHCLEYIWELFGRVIRERNPDIRFDDLMA
ncbi:hypothetical protein VU01_11991 [Candidatus Electrothrix marina]|uniref:Uncharacterized protein n=1 Tax=Candidatus Electrothrix marina TaxID=1859130 RepID=A0A444JDQ6_9BACT|nr:hypothetical protein VU01_11991 [Candidatus Electrothrix marina]